MIQNLHIQLVMIVSLLDPRDPRGWDYYDDRERAPGWRQPPPRERSPFYDDHMGPPRGGGGAANTFNGGLAKEMEQGILGLPQDKVGQIRDKKEEIEKVRRASIPGIYNLWKWSGVKELFPGL